MIELKDISKRYGSHLAVDRLNLTVPAGQIFGFLGPNGAGKTTTIRMLGGLIEPSAGTVAIGGIDMNRYPEAAKQQIGFIPDRPYLYEKLTGMEFLRFIADLYGVADSEFSQRAGTLFTQFGLQNWQNELIEAYSHGMKQRLIMAAAILHEPKVIIVDEPMVGLDPAGIRMVRALFRNLAEDREVAFFVSTHTLAIAQKLCDRIGIIDAGRLIGTGTMDDLKIRAGATETDLESVFLTLTREQHATDDTLEAI